MSQSVARSTLDGIFAIAPHLRELLCESLIHSVQSLSLACIAVIHAGARCPLKRPADTTDGGMVDNVAPLLRPDLFAADYVTSWTSKLNR